uniref:HYLS1_C domain-containing protein n=1 Tax=Onchocerca volvulus TaxID=6282 RepID=A0A8R1TW74_ONCVO
MESFTEKELLATINDMGYDLSPEELIFFKKEMDQFLDELERENEQQSQNQNISFNSLTKNVGQLAAYDIPCNYDKERLFYAEQYRHLPSYENLELHINQKEVPRSSTSINRYGILDHDEIVGILDDGYRCLRQIAEDNSRLQDLNSRLKQNLYRGRANLLSSDESMQNLPLDQAINDMKEHSDEAKSDNAMIAVDPAIRPVLHPLPGGVPFRHDPVKKYELYKKGWLENPPPGEKKRLSLRWKVREFMLRRDISGVKPMDLARKRMSNPDWFPRPYLD